MQCAATLLYYIIIPCIIQFICCTLNCLYCIYHLPHYSKSVFFHFKFLCTGIFLIIVAADITNKKRGEHVRNCYFFGSCTPHQLWVLSNAPFLVTSFNCIHILNRLQLPFKRNMVHADRIYDSSLSRLLLSILYMYVLARNKFSDIFSTFMKSNATIYLLHWTNILI